MISYEYKGASHQFVLAYDWNRRRTPGAWARGDFPRGNAIFSGMDEGLYRLALDEEQRLADGAPHGQRGFPASRRRCGSMWNVSPMILRFPLRILPVRKMARISRTGLMKKRRSRSRSPEVSVYGRMITAAGLRNGERYTLSK